MARGSIDRRDNGRYRARHEGTDGRWHSRTFDRRVDAERWLSDQVSRTSHGTWIDPNAGLISLEEYSEAWLAAKSRLKPKTRQGYLSLLRSRILPELGDRRLATIDRAQVGSWVSKMTRDGLSPSRIRQAHQCLAAILEQAVDDRLISQNPARRVELPRQAQPEHRYLTSDQVERLAEAMPDPQYSTMVFVLAYGGLRWGELAALRRDRVDVLRRQLHVTEALAELGGRLEFGSHQDTPLTNGLPSTVRCRNGRTAPQRCPARARFPGVHGTERRTAPVLEHEAPVLEPGEIKSWRGPGGDHPARPPAHVRVADESGRRRREGNPAAARSPQRDRDPRHLHPPLRRRPRRDHGQTRCIHSHCRPLQASRTGRCQPEPFRKCGRLTKSRFREAFRPAPTEFGLLLLCRNPTVPLSRLNHRSAVVIVVCPSWSQGTTPLCALMRRSALRRACEVAPHRTRSTVTT